MTKTGKTASAWRLPLVRELAVVLAIKLALLLGIRAIWFDQPTVPENGAARVAEKLLGAGDAPSIPLRAPAEEAPE